MYKRQGKDILSIAAKKLDNIKSKLFGKKKCLIADESFNSQQKYLNILAGDLENPSVSFLISAKPIEVVNYEVAAQEVDDAVNFLNCDRGNFLLFLSDTVRYMVKAGNCLKFLFPKMRHVTCFSHLINNCAAFVKASFEEVDNLIARVKTVTVKNIPRTTLFKQKYTTSTSTSCTKIGFMVGGGNLLC